MKPLRRKFHVSDLVLVSPAPAPDMPPLAVGDRCRLNSGGPDMLVVDATADAVVVAWADGAGGVSEAEFRRAVVRRIP